MTKLESFLKSQSRADLEKAGFFNDWFDKDNEWYIDKLTIALSKLSDSREEVFAIVKEEIESLLSSDHIRHWG